jgi:hypothetical protein
MATPITLAATWQKVCFACEQLLRHQYPWPHESAMSRVQKVLTTCGESEAMLR